MKIIELAKEASATTDQHQDKAIFTHEQLERFAALVRAEALEEARTGEWINGKGDVLKLGSSWRLK